MLLKAKLVVAASRVVRVSSWLFHRNWPCGRSRGEGSTRTITKTRWLVKRREPFLGDE